MATHYKYPMLSYENLHRLTNRSTPEMLSNYKLAILLHKLYNNYLPEGEWIALNFMQTLMSRQVYFHVNRSNITRVGMNTLCNRLFNLNDKIPLNWLNKSTISYKLDCKNCLLKFWLYTNVFENDYYMIDHYFFIVIQYYSEINTINHQKFSYSFLTFHYFLYRLINLYNIVDLFNQFSGILSFKLNKLLQRVFIPTLVMFDLFTWKYTCLDISVCIKLSDIHSPSGR
jgi:hypothetical protein